MNVLISELLWWQTALLGIYSLYTLARAIWIFNEGLKDAVLGYGNTIKLYHILWAIIDIPAIILGMLFPFLKMLFSIPIFPLKEKK